MPLQFFYLTQTPFAAFHQYTQLTSIYIINKIGCFVINGSFSLSNGISQ